MIAEYLARIAMVTPGTYYQRAKIIKHNMQFKWQRAAYKNTSTVHQRPLKKN